ncbi:Low specificity L-threonine aldolase [Luminiphilus syltensis NOR5-1B]|uniref:L-threonine aldolase n=1 Tax=Luminiphilus syltensis NOR5-1B TaxID=565045 RepID=B8KWP8_9GAMM|nr:Low specificity L-threonine aldolase [Luminiphilus syltensis NOR5-1B]
MSSRAFASDNQAGVHPTVMNRMALAAEGFASAYGNDALTRQVEAQLSERFETDCSVFLVGTGTAANALALSALCPPHGAVLCHREAHIVNDECTAPEFFTGGARQVSVPGEWGKPDLAGLEYRMEQLTFRGVHSVKPSVLSLSNATEMGTIYGPGELARYGSFCRRHGLALHVDGARFANALASQAMSAAELSWKQGVDVLTLGATKGGAMAAEAVIFFNRDLAEDFGFKRKRGGHLWSKHRLLAAQFEGWLSDGLWLELARQANQLARNLADGLAEVPGISISIPVEANMVFPILPAAMAAALRDEGFEFYDWPTQPGMVRLVTSFATEEASVEDLIARARHHAE